MTLLQEALAPRSDQLNADDLIPGPRTLKITGARFIDAGREGKKVIISYEGDSGKPFKPCKTMGRAMVMVWGVVDSDDPEKISAQFVGKSITVFRDPTVDFGADKGIGGIRISHMSHISGPKSVKLTVSQGKRGQFVFQPLTAEVTPMRQAKQTAEEWAAEHIGEVQNAATIESLSDLIGRGAKPMGKLERDTPALWTKVNNAYAGRRAELEREGPADDQRGDGFGDDDN